MIVSLRITDIFVSVFTVSVLCIILPQALALDNSSKSGIVYASQNASKLPMERNTLSFDEMKSLSGGWYANHYCRSLVWGWYSQCDSSSFCNYSSSGWYYKQYAISYYGCYYSQGVSTRCTYASGTQQCAQIIYYYDQYCLNPRPALPDYNYVNFICIQSST